MSPLSLLILATSLASSFVSASDVVTLTTANFDEQTQAATGDNGSWLVEFYAPWCGHCKKLQPTWEELATEVKGQFHVGKVDVTENRDLGSRYEIKGFPTIKFFNGGLIFDYKGSRTIGDFKKFATEGYTSAEGRRA